MIQYPTSAYKKQHHDEYNAPLSHNGINTCFAITPCLLSVPCWSATFTVSSGWSCDRIPSRAASEHTNVIYPTKPIIHNYPLSNYPSPKTNIVNGAHCYHTYCSSWKLRLCRRIASECMMVISSGQCVSVVSLFIGSVLLLPIIDTGYWPLTRESSWVNISRIRWNWSCELIITVTGVAV